MSQTADITISTIASKSTYTGAGMTIGGWLLSSEFAVLVGMIVGVTGLIVNIVFKIREDRRQERMHQEKIKQLRGE
jgi:ABC-type transport system involved in cytochrome bd biosynthesis fused ATPase/permease subunit